MSAGNPLIRDDSEIRERWIAGALFVTTCASVFLVYWLRWQTADWLTGLGRSVAFTATLMGILLAHEMGHVLGASRHAIKLAPPWFLPAPILVGTFGAIIRWADVPRTRAGLLEMGAGGPLAGLAAIIGVATAWTVLADPLPVAVGETQLTPPLLFWFLSGIVHQTRPEPLSTQDPVIFAAWIGCLVTAMNLIPIGQLDGSHVVAALWPSGAKNVGRVATAVLLLAGLLWIPWAIWAAMAVVLGGDRGQVRDERPPGPRQVRMAVLCGLAWVLCVTPVPVR